jgi:dUTP pyrophosphatase
MESQPSPRGLPVRKLYSDAKMPVRANPTDAGLDLFAQEDGSLLPGQRTLVSTGISITVPINHYGRIAPRSGLAVKAGIDVLAGVIDHSYTGEVKVVLINLSNGDETQRFTWRKGDKIAQLIIEKCLLIDPVEVGELASSARGAGGFGSTGV